MLLCEKRASSASGRLGKDVLRGEMRSGEHRKEQVVKLDG